VISLYSTPAASDAYTHTNSLKKRKRKKKEEEEDDDDDEKEDENNVYSLSDCTCPVLILY